MAELFHLCAAHPSILVAWPTSLYAFRWCCKTNPYVIGMWSESKTAGFFSVHHIDGAMQFPQRTAKPQKMTHDLGVSLQIGIWLSCILRVVYTGPPALLTFFGATTHILLQQQEFFAQQQLPKQCHLHAHNFVVWWWGEASRRLGLYHHRYRCVSGALSSQYF